MKCFMAGLSRSSLFLSCDAASPVPETRAAPAPRMARMPPRPSNAARRRVFALLQEDHRAIAAAFAAVEGAPPGTDSASLAPRVDAALALLERHAALELELFYPAVRGAGGERVEEAEVEHDAMAGIVAQIRAGGPLDLKFHARVRVLAEYARHHMAEEEGTLFEALESAVLDWEGIEARLSQRHGPAPSPEAAPAKAAPRKRAQKS
jgi:hypothetical protein